MPPQSVTSTVRRHSPRHSLAPLVEETLKGIGVLIIVVVRRNSINSVLDGVVYAGFSAAGFLFFEDILYFLRTEGQGTKTLVFVFVLRALAGPSCT